MANKFKFSALRQFGSENVSFTSEIESDTPTLSQEQVDEQVNQIDSFISKAFKACIEREFKEKDVLADSADRRREQVQKLDKALQEEMEAKKNAEKTSREAEKLSKKLTK